jgi:PAS domain S-box-containing protein
VKTKSVAGVEHGVFRAFWETGLVGTLFATPDERVFAVSPAACRLFGRTEKEMCAIGTAGLVDFADKRVLALVRKRAEKGYARGEMTLVRSDGTRFPALLSSFAFETIDGSWTCTVIQDISKMKQAEERARVFSRQLLSVREEEKRQLSAVLHHEIGSVSIGLAASLLAVEEDLREDRKRQALASIRDCRRMFAQASLRLRALAHDLRPPDLDLLGLTPALRQHFRELRGVSSLRILFTDSTRGTKISPDAQTILFRAAQEGLNNVIKHSQAKWVRVRLTATLQMIRLTVTDGGKGFDAKRWEGNPGRHLGLQAVHEMVTSVGGVFVVQSTKGHGTTIHIILPREEQQM